MNDSLESLRTGLCHALAGELGRDVVIDGLAPLSMGASKDIWSFDAVTSNGRRRQLILRRDPGGRSAPEPMRREVALLRAAATMGVPVPAVVAEGNGGDGVGAPYIVMERIRGETLPRRILRDDTYAGGRHRMAGQLGRIAARIHAIPKSAVPGIESEDALELWRGAYRRLDVSSPAVELALRWLDAHRPEPIAPTVVHGDYRLGNLVVDENGVASVLDWELAHVGDPMLDLGWLCTKAWRFGSPHAVAGVGTVEELVDGYAEVAGWRPEPELVRWWQILSTLRWAVICCQQTARHLSGSEPSLELALIGRRFAENEHDLLLGIGLAEPVVVADPLGNTATDGKSVFGSPTSSQLLSALSGQLRQSANYSDRLVRQAIDVVHREILLADEVESTYAALLADIGCDTEHALAQRIREGVTAVDDNVLTAIRYGVQARLTVWNPKYLAAPG